MNTPELLNITEQTINSPDDDWTEGVYIVEVAWEKSNLIHRAVLWLGQLNPPPSDSFVEHFADEPEVQLWQRDPDAAKLLSPHNWIHGQYDDPITLFRKLPYYLNPCVLITGIDMMDEEELQVFGFGDHLKL